MSLMFSKRRNDSRVVRTEKTGSNAPTAKRTRDWAMRMPVRSMRASRLFATVIVIALSRLIRSTGRPSKTPPARSPSCSGDAPVRNGGRVGEAALASIAAKVKERERTPAGGR